GINPVNGRTEPVPEALRGGGVANELATHLGDVHNRTRTILNGYLVQWPQGIETTCHGPLVHIDQVKIMDIMTGAKTGSYLLCLRPGQTGKATAVICEDCYPFAATAT